MMNCKISLIGIWWSWAARDSDSSALSVKAMIIRSSSDSSASSISTMFPVGTHPLAERTEATPVRDFIPLRLVYLVPVLLRPDPLLEYPDLDPDLEYPLRVIGSTLAPDLVYPELEGFLVSKTPVGSRVDTPIVVAPACPDLDLEYPDLVYPDFDLPVRDRLGD